MTDLVVASHEFVALLNALHDRRERLVVRYPYFNLALFEYDPRSGAITHGVSEEALDAAREKYTPAKPKLADDQPAWSDLRDAMLSAGLLRYANHDEAAATLEREAANAANPSNPNPTFLAFDTNALYNRLPDRGLPLDLLTGRMGSFRYVVSEGVLAELDRAIADKYSEADVTSLAAKLHEGRSASWLRGRSFKKGRRAKLGYDAVEAFTKHTRAMRASCEPLATDKETNDRLIAQSYGAFRRAHHADLLLLTSDGDMTRHAQAAGVKSLHLQLPRETAIPQGFVDERTLARFVHDLAVAFGVVHLSGLNARLWGDWSAKTPAHGAAEMLRVDHGGGPVMETFARDVEASRAILRARSVV
ncbi:MAG TPA: hypothetical protein VM889_10270 [Candidatus Thermoplasmatota archaeon]|nr:hypothetical protein [Candidatus Thermoplasmatota archaeon]